MTSNTVGTDCKCGSSNCIASSGYYCTESTSTCADYPCPTVVSGTCDTCSDKDMCTAVTCNANKFNDDGNLNNGCELGCPTVADGTCDTCSDKDTCTAQDCH